MNSRRSGGRIEYVRLFNLVAVVIRLIACINYMNLTTARSVRRAREIGVRKVIGASKGSLIGQFLGEAILLAALAMVIALVPYGRLNGSGGFRVYYLFIIKEGLVISTNELYAVTSENGK